MKTQKELDFEKLYNTYRDQVFRLCLGFVQENELANDLFQEILIKIWKNLDKFKGESEVGTWIYRIAYNTAITFSSKEKRRGEKNIGIPPSLEIGEQESKASETEAKFQLLYQAIAELSESERIIATLLLEGTPYRVISEITGISENYVAVKVNRIKSLLTKKLSPSNYGK